MTSREPAVEPEGFHGDVTGLSLSDVIQLNGANAFSGCITVRHGSALGRIFFREGRIIHAEQGGKTGEEAFYDVMEWSSGHFSLEQNVSTTSHTIQRSTQFILMEALRTIDERRAGRPAATPSPAPSPAAAAPAPTPAPAAAPARSSVALLEAVKVTPGVTYAALVAKDGTCVEDAAFAGTALAGKAAWFAMLGDQVGALLGSGDLRSFALRGTKEHLLLFAGRGGRYLAVLVEAAAELGAVDAHVQKLLGAAG